MEDYEILRCIRDKKYKKVLNDVTKHILTNCQNCSNLFDMKCEDCLFENLHNEALLIKNEIRF